MMKNEDICNQMINELQKQYANFAFNNAIENTNKITKIAQNYFENVTVINSVFSNKVLDADTDKNNFFILVVNNYKWNKKKDINSKSANSKKIMQIIKEELEKLNYNSSYKGTRYLEDSIYLVYKSKYEKDNLTKEIYPIIAKRYNTSVENVKCNIIQASNNSYYECPQEIMEKYFGFPLISKPKTKDIIYAVIRKIEFLNFENK